MAKSSKERTVEVGTPMVALTVIVLELCEDLYNEGIITNNELNTLVRALRARFARVLRRQGIDDVGQEELPFDELAELADEVDPQRRHIKKEN